MMKFVFTMCKTIVDVVHNILYNIANRFDIKVIYYYLFHILFKILHYVIYYPLPVLYYINSQIHNYKIIQGDNEIIML